jgi:amiloride-sensitive sodium channel
MLFAVSMGGAAGLFVGASLLSFIELIYYFTIRLFVTVKRKHRQSN